MRLLPCLLLLSSAAAFSQEEPGGTGEDPSDSEASSMMRPGSDSPEAVHARKYDGPRRRAQAFLIPMDEGARTPTTRVAQAIESVLLHTPMYEVVDLGRALSVESTAEQAQHADAGRGLLKEANEAAASKGWPEAAGRYQRALQEFDKGLPAVGPREYAEVVLRLGTATYMSGEEKASRDLFNLAVRLDPQRRLIADEAAAPQLEQARAELSGARHCQLDVDVRPAGARIFMDGELRGQHVEAPAGKHLLRVERAGFYPYAEVIELVPRKPVKASITLSATPTAQSLNQIIAGASDEVGHGAAGKNVASLAQKFSLERVLIGSVRTQEESRMSLVLALVDATKHRVIASKTLTLVADGTDADQIEADTQSTVRKLISADDTDDGAASPADPAAPAPAASAPATAARKPMMPGALPPVATPSSGGVPSADDPGLVAHQRRVAVPAAAGEKSVPAASSADKTAPAASSDAPAPASKEVVKKREQKKAKGIKEKTGTEGWED